MIITSKNKRILVVSDIHLDIPKINYILSKENYDELAILGDVFDSHDERLETPANFTKACYWLRRMVAEPNVYYVPGNHDSYLFPFNKHLLCSGWTPEKRRLADMAELGPFEKYFRFHLFIDDILCTHAGVHPYFLPPFIDVCDLNALNNWLNEETEKAKIALLNGQTHWFFGAGKARGGNLKYGGLTWCDAKREFEAVAGLKQVFGHSFNQSIYIPFKLPSSRDIAGAGNLCIDCNLNEYLIIENGKKQIMKYSDL